MSKRNSKTSNHLSDNELFNLFDSHCCKKDGWLRIFALTETGNIVCGPGEYALGIWNFHTKERTVVAKSSRAFTCHEIDCLEKRWIEERAKPTALYMFKQQLNFLSKNNHVSFNDKGDSGHPCFIVDGKTVSISRKITRLVSVDTMKELVEKINGTF